MPDLIMLIGIPGSGKSTWIKQVDPLKYDMICPDKIRKAMVGDISDQTVNNEAWYQAKQDAIISLQNNMSVILDATNLKSFYRRSFVEGLPACNKKAILFPVDPEVACGRIKSDLEHGWDRARVPEETVYRMYGEFLYTQKIIESEGFEIIRKDSLI